MPKEHVVIFVLLCIIAFGAGYWHSSSKVDSDERVEVVAPPAPTIITNVVTNTLKEVVTNIVTATPQATTTPTPTPAHAVRSNPQDTSAQSASANIPASPSSPSAAGASSSFSPSVSQANLSVLSGQARAENSKSMSTPSAQPLAQSASGMNAARSNPQETISQSASAKPRPTPPNIGYQEPNGAGRGIAKGWNPIIEVAIREQLKKPTGELTKADLEKVTYLYLGRNKLTEAPKGLEKLTQLTELFLDHNLLTDVKGLENLTQLVELNLGGNPSLTKAQIAELQKALPKCNIDY